MTVPPRPPAPSPASDRRPIASRDTALAQRVADWLIARHVAPNTISVFGMLAGVGAGVALAATSIGPAHAGVFWLAGALLVQLRLLCNLFDGMVAVGADRSSPVGELYNEVPDRISDAATLIGLGYAAGGVPWLGFTAAVLAVFTAYLRAMGVAAGAGNHFCGPMAKPQRMFLVTITALYLALAPSAWHPQVAGFELPSLSLMLLAAGCGATGVRRLDRIARDLRGNP